MEQAGRHDVAGSRAYVPGYTLDRGISVDRAGALVDAHPSIEYVAGNVRPRPRTLVASSLVHSFSVCRHKSAVESNYRIRMAIIGH